jgi:hypothetical protein
MEFYDSPKYLSSCQTLKLCHVIKPLLLGDHSALNVASLTLLNIHGRTINRMKYEGAARIFSEMGRAKKFDVLNL